MRTAWVAMLVTLSLGLIGTSVLAAGEAPVATAGSVTGGSDESSLALTPVIGVDPTSLDFSRVCLGDCRDLVIQLFNNVSDPTSQLTITNLSIPAGPFVLVSPPATPFNIAGGSPGPRVNVTVRYCPSAGGPQNATFTITSANGAPPTLGVPLSGSGNRPPICNAGGPYSGNEGSPIAMNGTASNDPDGTITSYAWNFGDGNTGSGGTPSHTYATGGIYTVTLTVTDDCGVSQQCQTTADINALPNCDAGGPYSGNEGSPIAMNGTASNDPDGTITSYAWSFGDGNTGSGGTPSHTYATGGIYTVSLTVTDNRGGTRSCQTTADVNRLPNCDAGGPYSGNEGSPIAMNGSGSHDPDGTIVSYAWSFGDGNTGSGATPSHTYAAGGIYTVSLTVTDNRGGTRSCQTTADINALPNCDAGGPYSGLAGQPVAMNGGGSSDPDGTIVSYEWDFGDGNTGSGATPSHTYASAGVYNVQLCVTDNRGARICCQTTADIHAPNQEPHCDAGGPYTGDIQTPIPFDGTGSSDPNGTIVLYEWSFGDGGTATGATPTHS